LATIKTNLPQNAEFQQQFAVSAKSLYLCSNAQWVKFLIDVEDFFKVEIKTKLELLSNIKTENIKYNKIVSGIC
jgi:hypothetical protein